MRSKKGQGISMETIVVAVIVVAVLVVLLLVFTGRINIFGTNLKQCSTAAGICDNDCIIGDNDHAKLFKLSEASKQCPVDAPGDSQYCCSVVGVPRS